MRMRAVTMGAILAAGLVGGASMAGAEKTPKPMSAKRLDALTNGALAAMKSRAAALQITGVAVVAYAAGESVAGWSSKMAVVGRITDPPSAAAKGNNLLAIAYAKAAEMAETLEDSGTGKRPPMTGEFGWQGGVIARVKSGYAIAAFSGGKSEDDVEVSKAGLAALKGGL